MRIIADDASLLVAMCYIFDGNKKKITFIVIILLSCFIKENKAEDIVVTSKDKYADLV